MTAHAHHTRTGEGTRNWAGNLSFSAQAQIEPAAASEIQAAIAATAHLKALGSRHSFSTVADTTGTLVSPRFLESEPTLDRAKSEVTVPAGMRYGELAAFLWERGCAVPNLASLPHISVVGACATATHGSGVTLGNLATSVRAFDIITGTGELRHCSPAQDGDRFNGMVVHLGALGVVTSITLQVQPAFQIAQTVYENLPLEALLSNFEEIVSRAYSVSLFTDWRDSCINQVWLKELVGAAKHRDECDTLFGARRAHTNLHPVTGVSAESCTPQCGVPGPFHMRLPHFKLEHTPSVGDELQTEYFVSRTDAPEAIRRLSQLSTQVHPLVLTSEIRTIAADSLWLSPQYNRDSVGIHFTWRNNLSAVQQILPVIEEVLRDLHPTPHWAKISTISPDEVRSRFSRCDEFQELAREFDPEGKFHNDFLRRYVLR